MARIYKRRRELPYTEALRYLLNPDGDRVSNAKPAREDVRANSMYVYQVFENTTERHPYWRNDGFLWENKGSHKQPNRGTPLITKKSFHLLSNGSRVDFHRHEFVIFGNKLDPPNRWQHPHVVVFYCGSFDCQLAVNAQHGNRIPSHLKRNNAIYQELADLQAAPHAFSAGRGGNIKRTATKNTARKSTAGAARDAFNLDELLQYKGAKSTGRNFDEFESATQDTLVLSPKRGPARQPGNLRDEISNKPNQGNVDDATSGAPSGVNECQDENSFADATNASPPIPHVRTDFSVLEKIRAKVQSGKGSGKTYRETTFETVLQHGVKDPSLTPRDQKQVYNEKEKNRREQETHDDFYEVILFAKSHPDIILDFVFVPSTVLIQVHPDMSRHVKSFQKAFTNSVYHYDTTFDVGKFYTSILSVRHPLFRGEPLIPVAVMFHEKTDEKSHALFFQTIAESLEINKGSTIIVTDREKSIRQAINKHLGLARNVFCWNHLIRNVGDWVQQKMSSADVPKYKADIRNLLHSLSVSNYQTQKQYFFSEWEDQFISYFNDCLNDDIERSYRPALEGIGIYNKQSGITNNPAESANKDFKEINDRENASMYQVSQALYFYQVSKLLEIWRGCNHQGNYQMSFPEVPPSLVIPEDFGDCVEADLIPSLIFVGKLPPGLVTSVPYKTPSLSELTTIRGLAEFFIAKDRIHFVPKCAVFVVIGLRGKPYMVNLKSRTCSCDRKNICEHLLAVLKSTGTLVEKTLKRNQPNIGAAYRKCASKNAGTKAGQTQRTRIVIPKSRAELLKSSVSHPQSKLLPETNAKQDPKYVDIDIGLDSFRIETEHDTLNPEEETISGNEDSSSALPAFNKTAEINPDGSVRNGNKDNDFDVSALLKLNKLQTLPVLKAANMRTNVLSLPCGNIRFAELKPIDSMTMAERRVLPKFYGPGYDPRTADWMVDSTVDGFLFKISSFLNNGTISMTTAQSTILLNDSSTMEFFADIPADNWRNIHQILIPINPSGDHWVLCVVKTQTRNIIILDPSATYELMPDEKEMISNLVNSKYNYLESDRWDVVYTEAATSFGRSMQCGPLVCFYAEACVRDWSLHNLPLLADYRHHILATLIGGCVISSAKRRKCGSCDKSFKGVTLECSFCKQPLHADCMTSVEINNVIYNICRMS